MELVNIFSEICRMRGIDSSEFMRLLNMDRSSWYKWSDGTNTPMPSTLRRIEKEFSVEFVRNRNGEITGVREVSLPDIASSGAVPDIQSSNSVSGGTNLEQAMIDRYNEIARKAHLQRWEDLEEVKRDEIRAELVVNENELDRVRKDGENAVIRLALKK